MTTPPLKVAGVGAGYFSQFHYGSWVRIPGVDLVGLCDTDSARAQGAAQAAGCAAFDDLQTLLRETTPDVLDLILPPDAQAQAIRTAVAAGVRTIICQKPFCTSLQEARDITDEVLHAGVQLVIHENFRFQPWYRCIRHALDAGLVGDVQQMTFRLRPGDGQGADAYLDRQPYFRSMKRFLIHETGVHWIDTFRYLLGEPRAVYADLRRINPAIAGEDAGYVIFDHPGGVKAILDANRHLDHKADNQRRTMGEALVEGTQGVIALHGSGAVTLREFGKTKVQTLLPASQWDGFGGDCVHHLQQHVVASVTGKTMPENTAASYLKVIETEEAVYRSAETGRKIALG